MDTFEELTKYKQLLDQGIITQEEFDDLKRKVFEKTAFHEHLNTGARVALESFGSLKKKTEGAYETIKEKGNKWIERELEKERIKEEQKKALKNEQIKENRNKLGKIAQYAKKLLSIIMMIVFLSIVIFAVFFFFREKVNFSADRIVTIHGLEYSISNDYKKRKNQNKNDDDTVIASEKDEFEIYSKSNTLIATYSIEYLGEDINLEKHKEEICRSLLNREINQSNNSIIIDGYYKKKDLSIHNITGNGLVKQRVLLFTKDYSCFKVVYKCNAWNYSADDCDQLFDAVKINQYKNKNIAETLDVTYNGSFISGYKPIQEDFKVEVRYKNGKRSVAEVFQLHAPKQLDEKGSRVMVECHGIKKQVYIRPSDDEKEDKRENQSEKQGNDILPFGADGQQV